MANHRDPGAVGPDLQLLRRRRPEGVPRREKHPLALRGIEVGQLADRGGLAHPVDPDDQNHRRLALRVKRPLGREGLDQQLLERTQRLGAGAQLLSLDPLAQLFDQLFSGGKTGIGQHQLLEQLLVGVLVNPVGLLHLTDRTENRIPGLGQTPSQFFKKAHTLLLFL